MIRSGYKEPERRDYGVERCLWIHREAVVSMALLHDPSHRRSRTLGNIFETARQVVGAPLLGYRGIEEQEQKTKTKRMFDQRIENFSECLEVPQERWEAQQDMSKGMAAARECLLLL